VVLVHFFEQKFQPDFLLIKVDGSVKVRHPNGNMVELDHNNPMRRHCQFTVKRLEKRVDLTVAAAANTEISFGAVCYGS